MKITTTRENKIVINSVVGEVNFDKIAEYLYENIESWMGKPEIWDMRETDLSAVSSDQLRLFVERTQHLTKEKRGEKTAIVASQDMEYGMMRMLETFAENASYEMELHVFRTIEEAKQWLLGTDK